MTIDPDSYAKGGNDTLDHVLNAVKKWHISNSPIGPLYDAGWNATIDFAVTQLEELKKKLNE